SAVSRGGCLGTLQQLLPDRPAPARVDHRRALPTGPRRPRPRRTGQRARRRARRSRKPLWTNRRRAPRTAVHGRPAPEPIRPAAPGNRSAGRDEGPGGPLRRSPPRHGAVPVALDAFERADAAVTVRDLARRVGLSQRRFIQLFTAEVGLTPKLYGRVRRFQRARELVREATEPDWAKVAVACGFFDQSHLIRDFREFSGLSPLA